MNPFTERERITSPARFTGRWREVSMVFDRLEMRRPVMLAGAAGIGKSSLLTHVAQSAGAVLEIPDLLALFMDLALLPDAATACRLLVRELGGHSDDLAALEVALGRAKQPVLICLDGVDAAIAAGWGAGLLEGLARLARRSAPAYPCGTAPPGAGFYDLMLVAAAGTTPPALSEPFATVVLGAVTLAEVRLLAEAYLDDSGVAFTPAELRELAALSAGHPAYLQRAAYHLFAARSGGDPNWRARYLAEARERPVPGAPLPPEAFQGNGDLARTESLSHDSGEHGSTRAAAPGELIDLDGSGELVAGIAPLLAALLALWLSGNWLLAAALLLAGYAVVVLALRRRR